MRKTYRSDTLGAIHETASDLHDAGLMDKRTLRKFDELCLTPIRPMQPDDIRARYGCLASDRSPASKSEERAAARKARVSRYT